MPPKKKGKGKGKGKKKGKKGKKGDDLTPEDMLKKTDFLMQNLKEEADLRKVQARSAKAEASNLRVQMRQAEDGLETQRNDTLDISSEMTRQYKTMQTELGYQVHHLKMEVKMLQDKLEMTEIDLNNVRVEKEKITKDKDNKIEELQRRVESMEISYDNILHEALDNLVDKMDAARHKWEDQSLALQQHNKKLMQEFGLRPLDI